MRKTLLYLLLLSVLGTLAWLFLFRESDGVFNSAEAGFTIKDTASISRIFLSDKSESVTLTRTDSGWRVNGKYPVLPNALKVLMEALQHQHAISPVPQAAHNNVVRALSASSIKAEFYAADGSKIRSFFVGNEANGFDNTYMLMEGAKRPYIVGMPGFEGFLTPRYTPKLYDWRDRTVFNVPAENIRRVAITYPAVPENSFAITVKGKDLEITPSMPGISADPKRLRDYLAFFQKINAEGFVNGNMDIDTLLRVAPLYATIRITTDKRTHLAELYWMAATQRTSFANAKMFDERLYDAERKYAVLDRQDTVVVQALMMGKILQPRGAFFPQKDGVDSAAHAPK